MKTLLLMRHAKSSWEQPGLRDFDRPLNGRGLKAAPLVGRYLHAQGLKPDLIVSSPANRAQHTAQLVHEAANFTAPIRYEAAIYEASLDELLAVVHSLDETAETVLLVGHNPGFSVLLSHLTNTAEDMTTAAVANVSLDSETWATVRAGQGRLEWLVKPKQLAEND
jgi:phosphohistidine phosphatase